MQRSTMMQRLEVRRPLGFMGLLFFLVAPTAWGYCDSVADGVWDAASAEFEQQALEEINALRQRGTSCGGDAMPAVAPLTMDVRLQCAARNHARDLPGVLGHENPNEPAESTPAKRANLAGFPKQVLENISWGYRTPAAVVNQHWANSALHCKNLMSANDDITGIGFDPGADGNGYWTVVIGKSDN